MSASNADLTLDLNASKGSWGIFLAGLALFIMFQAGLVLEVQLRRALPPEVDDAYCYIYNAVQLREGFRYHTPALEDFRSQTAPETGDSVERQWIKWYLYHSLFFTHYIIHSALLLVTSWVAGVSLETAYKIFCVLGSLFIAGAISYFLLTITDRISAGLALGSLALTIFPNQGIHYVVPTNICMALGLILLGHILRNGGKSKWVLFGLSTICVFLNRSGVIYACLGVLTLIFLRYRESTLKEIIFDSLPTLVLIYLFMFITFITPLPIFHLYQPAKPLDTSYLKEVYLNFIELLRLIGGWFLNHGVVMGPKALKKLITNNLILFLSSQILGLCLVISFFFLRTGQREKYRNFLWITGLGGAIVLLPTLSAIVLIIILRAGWLYPPPEKKSSLHLAFFVFLFLLPPSLLYVLYIAEPGHPIVRADLTNRLWVPFAVIWAAIFARGLWWIFQNIRRGSYDFLPKNLQDQELVRKVLNPRYVWAVSLSFVVISYTPHLVEAYHYRTSIKHNMVTRQNVVFDLDQVRYALKNTYPHEFILSDDDIIRPFVLCHGGLWRRAIYLPLLPLPDNFNITPEAIKYKISWNPYLSIQNLAIQRAVHYPLIIPGGSVLELTLDSQFKPDELQILSVSNTTRAGSSTLRIIRKSESGVIGEKDIQLSGNDWQVFPLIPERSGTLLLFNLEPAKPFFLAGLKLGKEQHHNFLWPWHGVINASLHDNQLKIHRSVTLPWEEKIKGITYGLEVLQDKGSTVLWRLWPKREE